MKESWKYRLGDLLAGVAIGATVALAQHLVVPQNHGVLTSMLYAMLAGMAAQMILSIMLGSFLGSLEVMLPGMVVSMFGMFLPMLRIHHLETAMGSGAVLGFLVFLAFAIWDERLRGTALRLAEGSVLPEKVVSGWWNAPQLYDALEREGGRRREQFQRQLFRQMEGRILFVSAGTGLNFANFPPNKEIVAIDISPRMLEAAQRRAEEYIGSLVLCEADVLQLQFPDESFDTVATGSTLCSVPDPVQGLKELFRVLKPGGKLLMYEHVRSRNPVTGTMLDLLNAIVRRLGPSMNRDTIGNARKAGFVIDQVVCAYLDVFLAIEAHKPLLVAASDCQAA